MRQIVSGDTPAALDLASQGYRAAGPRNFSATRCGDTDLFGVGNVLVIAIFFIKCYNTILCPQHAFKIMCGS